MTADITIKGDILDLRQPHAKLLVALLTFTSDSKPTLFDCVHIC